MEWLFAHMDDTGKSTCLSRNRRKDNFAYSGWNALADLDDPLPPPESSGAAPSGGNEPSPQQISMIVDMGFTPQQGKKALLETVRSSFRSLLSISSTAH